MDVVNIVIYIVMGMVVVGLLVKIVFLFDFSLKVDVIFVGVDIKIVVDLKGKNVVFEEGMISDIFLNYVFISNGMIINDIICVLMFVVDVGLVLIVGKVLVVVIYEFYILVVMV